MNNLTTHVYDEYTLIDVKNNLQYEVEYEVILRLINSITSYQQLILAPTSTCADMFTDKDLKRIYEISKNYVSKYGINALNAIDLINSLQGNDVLYVQYIWDLKQNFICSADSVNWVKRLQNLYKKRLETQCRTFADLENVNKEIAKYKIENIESNIFDESLKYLDDYETKANNIVLSYYKQVDRLIGGFMGGNFVIIAANTGMGKTAIALNLALNMAKHDKKSLIISLEMGTDELLMRIVSSQTGISSINLRNRNLTDNEMNTYVRYIGTEQFKQIQNNITIPNIKRLNISVIEEIIRKSKADIIFIDYLSLIKGDNNELNKYEEVTDISRRLKLLAIETNKPIICLQQLNRDVKNRQNKRPSLSDIRDSGAIEQDADIVAFCYRPSYYDPNEEKTKFEFIVGKSRHSGGAGQTAYLRFDGAHQKITDPTGETEREVKQCTINY